MFIYLTTSRNNPTQPSKHHDFIVGNPSQIPKEKWRETLQNSQLLNPFFFWMYLVQIVFLFNNWMIRWCLGFSCSFFGGISTFQVAASPRKIFPKSVPLSTVSWPGGWNGGMLLPWVWNCPHQHAGVKSWVKPDPFLPKMSIESIKSSLIKPNIKTKGNPTSTQQMLSHEILANWRSKVCKTSIPKKGPNMLQHAFLSGRTGLQMKLFRSSHDSHASDSQQLNPTWLGVWMYRHCLGVSYCTPLEEKKKTWHRNRKIPSFNTKIPSFNRKCIFIVDFPPSHVNFWGGGGNI